MLEDTGYTCSAEFALLTMANVSYVAVFDIHLIARDKRCRRLAREGLMASASQ